MLISTRLKKELPEALKKLQDATGQSRNEIINIAISEYVERESWQVAETLLGMEEAHRGEFATSEQMQALNDKWGYNEN